MPNPDWLSFAICPEESGRTNSYIVSLIEAKYKVDILPGGYFVMNRPHKDIWIEFAVLEDVGGLIADDGGTISEAECIFHGEGPSGNLRECRHTYWGEQDDGGYIFYPSGRLITAAFARLSEFFDDMA